MRKTNGAQSKFGLTSDDATSVRVQAFLCKSIITDAIFMSLCVAIVCLISANNLELLCT